MDKNHLLMVIRILLLSGRFLPDGGALPVDSMTTWSSMESLDIKACIPSLLFHCCSGWRIHR